MYRGTLIIHLGGSYTNFEFFEHVYRLKKKQCPLKTRRKFTTDLKLLMTEKFLQIMKLQISKLDTDDKKKFLSHLIPMLQLCKMVQILLENNICEFDNL